MLYATIAAALVLLAQPETQPDTQPLAGPTVPESRLRSLVQQGMTTGFHRIEGRPESAAARLLDLEQESTERIRAIELDRETKVVFMLVDKLDDLRAMTDANAEGDTETARQIMRDWWLTFDSQGEALPMIDEIGQSLTPESFEEVKRLSEEYFQAWIKDAALENETPEQTRKRLAFQLFQEEIYRAYEASLRQTQQALQAIYNAIEPTPEQREQIRSVIIEHIKRTRLSATPNDRRKVMRQIYDLLDESRKAKLFDYAMQIVIPEA